ncbi:hypothetical protein NIES2101_16025 [Calothrix sp. HK-06]|nr:hypothetical protein NIES2101_16025 [Calothrix sp. HK-06]
MIVKKSYNYSNEVFLVDLNENILNTKYQVNLRNLIKFEIISLYGRIFLNRKPKTQNKDKNLLNLGCGSSKFEGWTNADYFKIFRPTNRKRTKPDWMLDIRFPMNCKDNTWDGVFTEHTLEHLYPIQALNLLKELHRTMKPGAWLRITVPDLRKYMSYYNSEKVDEKFSKWQTGCEAIRALTQDWGHVSVWDNELLENFLIKTGFVNINEVSFAQGSDKTLLKDKEERTWETLYMEAQKPQN